MATRLGLIPEIRLENSCRAHREEIFIGNRLRHYPPTFNQRLRIVTCPECLAVRLACRRQSVAEIRQFLTTQEHFTVRKRLKHITQMQLMRQVVLPRTRFIQ
ncbi:hypothetical protein D3C76_1547040 [compost metagenome]